jgi:hypothetical protein
MAADATAPAIVYTPAVCTPGRDKSALPIDSVSALARVGIIASGSSAVASSSVSSLVPGVPLAPGPANCGVIRHGIGDVENRGGGGCSGRIKRQRETSARTRRTGRPRRTCRTRWTFRTCWTR